MAGKRFVLRGPRSEHAKEKLRLLSDKALDVLLDLPPEHRWVKALTLALMLAEAWLAKHYDERELAKTFTLWACGDNQRCKETLYWRLREELERVPVKA